ncbi:MAG: sensor histidine kinase [Desulfurellaceae bacterium]|nr:sensor histidine kinase [Desulfurellaceae bacterium]
MATISSAFWAPPLQGEVAHHTPSEKILARLRWLALGVGAGLLWFNPPVLYQAAAPYCLLGSALYCFFGQYFAYRHYKGTPLPFPIGLSDVVFAAVLCGVSGGLLSPLSVYLYGLTLIATLRFGWQAGFGMALVASLASVLLLFLAPPSSASIPELYPSLALRCTLLLGIAGLAGLFSAQHLSQDNAPKTIPNSLQANPIETLQEKLALLEIDPLLQQLVNEVLRRIPCRGVCVILLDPDTRACVKVKTAGTFPTLTPSIWDHSFAAEGALQVALTLGLRVLNTSQDIYARLQALSEKELAQRHLLIHQLGNDSLLGCFLLSDRKHREGFRPQDSKVLADIAQYALPAVQRAYTLAEAHRSVTELRGLLHTVLNAQEEERQRIVSEWHHQIGERLFRVFQDFHGFQEFVLQHAPAGRERFTKLASELDTISVLVRQFTNGLLPPVLEDFGLVQALRAYVTDLQEQEPFEVVMQADDGDRSLPTQTSRTLFRITQEALHNVQRHAKANRVQIALTFEQQGVSLMIKDDGQGFQPEQSLPGHYGLLYMREQAVSCGGRFSVQSQHGRGTEVRVELPITEDPAPAPDTNAESFPPAPPASSPVSES